MNFLRRFSFVFLLMILLGMVLFGLSEHLFDEILGVIALGQPLWVFVVLILLVVVVHNQNKILSSFNSLQNYFNQPTYNPEEYPEDEQ